MQFSGEGDRSETAFARSRVRETSSAISVHADAAFQYRSDRICSGPGSRVVAAELASADTALLGAVACRLSIPNPSQLMPTTGSLAKISEWLMRVEPALDVCRHIARAFRSASVSRQQLADQLDVRVDTKLQPIAVGGIDRRAAGDARGDTGAVGQAYIERPAFCDEPAGDRC